MTAIVLSLKIASLSAMLVMPIAIIIARFITRPKRRISTRILLETSVALPLVMPPIATGYLLLIMLGNYGIAFTMTAAVIAASMVSLPLAVRSVRVSMESLDPHVEEVALNLGLSPWRTFRLITLPLCWPGIVSGTVLVFIRSLGEFGATLMFAGNIPGQTQTLSLALWSEWQTPGGDSRALRLLAFSVMFGFFCLLLSEIVVRRMRK